MGKHKSLGKEIRIGLFVWFLLALFMILSHVHKRQSQRGDVHKTCVTCLLQNSTIPLESGATAIGLLPSVFQYTKQPSAKPKNNPPHCLFRTTHPNKAPPAC